MELADVPDSKSGPREGVWVQFPPSAPNQIPSIDKRDFVGRWFLFCPAVLAFQSDSFHDPQKEET